MQIAPALVCMDCQRFVLTQSDAESSTSVRDTIDAIENVLSYARDNNWVIVHTQMKTSSGPLRRTSPGSAPIESLRPRRHEFVFERSEPNAYASPSFTRAMSNRFGVATFLVGFAGERSVLTTLFEAARLGHRVIPVLDAIGCVPAHIDAAPQIIDSWRDEAVSLGDVAHVSSLPSAAIASKLMIGKTSR